MDGTSFKGSDTVKVTGAQSVSVPEFNDSFMMILLLSPILLVFLRSKIRIPIDHE